MKIPFLLAVLLCAIAGVTAGGASAPLFEGQPEARSAPAPSGKIDDFVFGKLRLLGLQPANVCNDAVFVRRVYLDAIGTLPTAEEVTTFLDDKNPNKRSVVIDRLLQRDEFADYWGMKWCDVLRVKSEFPVNLWPNATQAYDHWIRASIRHNESYSQFASDILTANGSNFRDPAVNFYRAAGSKDPKAMARAVALTFMGERTEHWPVAKLAGLAGFFSQLDSKGTREWKEEIVFFNGFDDARHSKTQPILPDGTPVPPSDKDPRQALAQWLTSSKNSPFAANAVNRIWFWLMGRGIVQEPDDFRRDNPPSNPELLSWLAQQLISSKYDIKAIYRLILNSNTYQLSSIPRTDRPEGESNFAFYPVRRMDAEVLIDALDQITGATEEYYSMTPEPYTWVPTSKRSICLPDGSITSSFLELFGRPPRDTGLLTERNNRPTSGQRLEVLNSTFVQSKITRSQKLMALATSAGAPLEKASQIYLTILSRRPTDDELKAVQDYSSTTEARGQQAFVDLTWSLMNSSEFLYRH